RREPLPRQIAMYLCRELLTEPYGTIAEYFDRDHTDALRAHRKVEQLRRTDAAIADDLALILLHVTPGSQPHRR
ncbi:MAG: helix-turn-helix domain-containing protein, partial [Actinomycetes bacterium]